jgi:hypothetical protein
MFKKELSQKFAKVNLLGNIYYETVQHHSIQGMFSDEIFIAT